MDCYFTKGTYVNIKSTAEGKNENPYIYGL